jgi:hypothetical protein
MSNPVTVETDLLLASATTSAAMQALFDEHASPTHCCTSKAKAMLMPAEDAVATARVQVAEYRRLVRMAELCPNVPAELRAKFNGWRYQLKETAEAVEAAADPYQRMTDKLHMIDGMFIEGRMVMEKLGLIAPSTAKEPSDGA